MIYDVEIKQHRIYLMYARIEARDMAELYRMVSRGQFDTDNDELDGTVRNEVVRVRAVPQ